MQVKVKYFAGLKEQLGQSEQIVDFDSDTTVAELWQQVSGHTELPDTVMSAINMEYVQSDTKIRDGDEIAFFPPVTGG